MKDDNRTMQPTGTAFRIGTVFQMSLSVLNRNKRPFLLVTGILLSPLLVYDVIIAATETPDSQSGSGGGFELLLGLFTYGLAEAALVYGTLQDLRGRRPTLSLVTSRGLAAALSVFGVIVATYALILLGFLLLLVPGLILQTIFWVAIPAAVIEKRGIGASLRRSRVLTKSYRWRIFGLVMIMIVIQVVVGIVGVLVSETGAFAEVWGPGFLAARFILDVWLTAIFAIASAVSYHLLRSVKEGVDIEEIARVFD